MALGPAVRALFGRYEHEVAALYRSMFVNFDNFADVIAQWASEPRRILEVGCGEGALTERLAGLFPSAEILAIDITPRAGRLYRGRSDGARFETIEVQKLADRGEAPFDLIILADVMHHIPGPLRPEILKSIGALMAPDGQFLMKDWGRNRAAIHWICHAADRWITGDKVHYLSADEGEEIVRQQLPALQTRARGTIRPWRNNYALLFGR
jgi:2-polyprenyl-6-hydroxyphenyl methylase/3-demethylubiquinone-9 3-methyltransferase